MKLAHTIMSDLTCKCGKQIKQNLASKKNRSSLLCYKCHRLATGKPAHHMSRRKRLEAGLPVH